MSDVRSHRKVLLAVTSVVLLVFAGAPAQSDEGLDRLLCGTLPVDPAGGCLQWEARHDGDSAGDDGPTAVVTSPDGSRVYVVGFSYARPPEITRYDYTVLAYDAETGDELWYETYSGPDANGDPGTGDDFAMAVAVSPDGSTLFVTGQSEGHVPGQGTSASGVATLAFDTATGDLLWESREHGPALGTDTGRGVVVAPDGETVLVSATIRGTGNQDVAVYAYDADTGDRLWKREYNGPGDGTDSTFFESSAISPDGSTVYVSMQSYSGPELGFDYTVLAYAVDGGLLEWEARHDGGDGDVDRAFSLDVAPDGSRVYVTGRARNVTTGYDISTVAFDTQDGSEVWASKYDADNLRDEARQVVVSPDGSLVFVTGSSVTEATGYDYATIAYDAESGTEVWVARHDGIASGTDVPMGLAVDPDSLLVYVTGRSAGASGMTDMVTLAYLAETGVSTWTSTYSGTGQGDDVGVDLTASPDGSTVYVTGDSYTNPVTTYDIATVAIGAGSGGLPGLPDPPL